MSPIPPIQVASSVAVVPGFNGVQVGEHHGTRTGEVVTPDLDEPPLPIDSPDTGPKTSHGIYFWIWVGIGCLGMCGAALNLVAAGLEKYYGREVDRLVTELYEPWDAARSKARKAAQQYSEDVAQKHLGSEEAVSRLKATIRPHFAHAVTLAQSFRPRTDAVARIRKELLDVALRDVQFVDEVMDGLQRRDQSLVNNAHTSYQAYSRGVPDRMRTVLAGIGMKPPTQLPPQP